jgi:arylformamidase
VSGGGLGPGWLDASVPVRDGMVHWPTDPPVEITLRESIAGGDPANLSSMRMSAHTGTHMDAPRHFIADGTGIDAFPPGTGIGPALVVVISDPQAVGAEELREAGIEDKRPKRLLLKTRNSETPWWNEDFHEDFVPIAPDAAELIVGSGIELIGIDYLSVGGDDAGQEAHRRLLGAGVWIVEGLDLSDVRAGAYELICLPLRLSGLDGAPARALLRPIEEGSG